MADRIVLSDLRAAAEGASPGRWDPSEDRVVGPESPPYSQLVASGCWPSDATHIAAADPPTVLALVEGLEQAREALAAVTRGRLLPELMVERSAAAVAGLDAVFDFEEGTDG